MAYLFSTDVMPNYVSDPNLTLVRVGTSLVLSIRVVDSTIVRRVESSLVFESERYY